MSNFCCSHSTYISSSSFSLQIFVILLLFMFNSSPLSRKVLTHWVTDTCRSLSVSATRTTSSEYTSVCAYTGYPNTKEGIPSEKLVTSCHSTRRHYPKSLNLQEHRSENLKPLNFLRCFADTYRPRNACVARHPSGTFLKCLHAMCMSCWFVNMVSSGVHIRKCSRPRGWPRRP